MSYDDTSCPYLHVCAKTKDYMDVELVISTHGEVSLPSPSKPNENAKHFFGQHMQCL